MRRNRWVAGVLGLLVAGCAADPVRSGEVEAPLWRFEANAEAVRGASCPEDVEFLMGVSIPLAVVPVPLAPGGETPQLGEGVGFVAGYHLVSPDARFGGLSGLAVTASGNLVAVSDQGAFVWLTLDEDTGVPSRSARIAPMYGANGQYLSGSKNVDAEGLALDASGLAIVSFERNHRVLAFDLEGCGAAARGVEVARWGDRLTGMRKAVGNNGGAEALAFGEGGTLLVGIETNDDESPFGPLREMGGPDVSGRVETPGLMSLTGADRLGGELFTVHRFYAPAVGTQISVARGVITADGVRETREIARLERPLTVDNFEGIAVQDRGDGTARVFVISDDNFSSDQRTLLLVFDVGL